MLMEEAKVPLGYAALSFPFGSHNGGSLFVLLCFTSSDGCYEGMLYTSVYQ